MAKKEKEGKHLKNKRLDFFYTQYTLPPSRCIPNLKILAQTGAEKSLTEIFVRKKIGQIKGLISNMWLIL